MRQAGRYLPEYRQTRTRAGDFLNLCKTPELACEVTLQPLARFELDAAIVFSDILTIPDAMGLGLSLNEGIGPRFERPVSTMAEIEKLHVPDPESELGYVLDTVRMVKRELADRIPLIGFAGSPWTLATYMIEGGSSRDFALTKALLYADPSAMHALLEKLATAVGVYLNAQIASGADAVMVFDTWGGILPHADYQSFSLRYITHVLRQLVAGTPTIVFTKGGGLWLEAIRDSGCSAIGLDWTVDPAQARSRVGNDVALQGNLDPAVLLTRPDVVAQQVRHVLDSFGPAPGHIFNLGHGITPAVPIENVSCLVETVHAYSKAQRRAQASEH